jgi:hypothetical protein
VKATATTTAATAEAQSQKTFGCAFDSLNPNQQRAILALLDLPAQLEAMKREQRSCMTCGRASSLRQCMNCREGHSAGYRPRFHSIV